MLKDKGAACSPKIVAELVDQYLDDNPGISNDSTAASLATLAESVLGEDADATKHLQAGAKAFGAIRDTQNEHGNYRGSDPDPLRGNRVDDQDRENRKALKAIARTTDPSCEAAFAKALSKVDQLKQIWHFAW